MTAPMDPAGELTPEQQEEIAHAQEQMMQQMAQGVGQLIHSLNPKLPLASCVQEANVAIRTSPQTQRVIDDAVAGSPRRESQGVWGFFLQPITSPGAPAPKPFLEVAAPKDSGEIIRDPNQILIYATILGALTNASVRAFLRAHGYDVHFFSRKAQSKLIIP